MSFLSPIGSNLGIDFVRCRLEIGWQGLKLSCDLLKSADGFTSAYLRFKHGYDLLVLLIERKADFLRPFDEIIRQFDRDFLITHRISSSCLSLVYHETAPHFVAVNQCQPIDASLKAREMFSNPVRSCASSGQPKPTRMCRRSHSNQWPGPTIVRYVPLRLA